MSSCIIRARPSSICLISSILSRDTYQTLPTCEGNRTVLARQTQSNGYAERFQRTLHEEHLHIQSRKKFYQTLEEMQKNLEDYLVR